MTKTEQEELARLEQTKEYMYSDLAYARYLELTLLEEKHEQGIARRQ